MQKLINEWKVLTPGVHIPFIYWDTNGDEFNDSMSESIRRQLIAWVAGRDEPAHADSPAFLLSVLATRFHAGSSEKVFEWLYGALLKHHDGRYGYPFIDEKVGDLSGRCAHALVSSMSTHLTVTSNARINPDGLQKALRHFSLPLQGVRSMNQTQEILVEAFNRGIPARRMTDLPSHRLGHGRKQRHLWRGFTDQTSHHSTTISTHKQIAASLLAEHGFPVPRHFMIDDQNNAVEAARRLGYPVVVKPASTDKGVGVSVDIASDQELLKAFDIARKHGKVLIEQMLPGFDHRLHVIDGRCAYVIKRMPAHIIGNGRDTILALFENFARERALHPFLRNFPPTPLGDPLVNEMLVKQGLSESSVPAQGRMVLLRSNSNVSSGGDFHDVTAAAHPDNILLAQRVAKCVGLDHAGIDFITPDISRSWKEIGGGICEVNPTPMIALESAQSELLDYLFPDGDGGAIPVIVVVGPIEAARPVVEHIRSRILERLTDAGFVIDRRAFLGCAEITAHEEASRTLLARLLGEPDLQFAVAQIDPDELLSGGLDASYCNLAVLVGDSDVVEKIKASPHSTIGNARQILVNPSIDEIQKGMRALNC